MSPYCPYGNGFCGVALAIIVTLYSAFGCIISVVRTDIVQYIFFGIAMPVGAYFAMNYIGGASEFTNNVPADMLNPLNNMNFTQLSALFLIFLFGDALIPPVVQRILISSNTKMVSRMFVYASFVIVFLVACTTIIGLVVSASDSNISASSVMPYAISNIFPAFFQDIFIAGLIAVVISSADSYLNSCSVTLTYDIIAPICPLEDDVKLKIARFITLIVGMIAIYLSTSSMNVVDILVFSYKFWGPVIVIPLICLMFDKVISKRGFYISSILVVIFVIYWNIAGLDNIYGIEDLIPAMILDAILFMGFYLFEKK